MPKDDTPRKRRSAKKHGTLALKHTKHTPEAEFIEFERLFNLEQGTALKEIPFFFEHSELNLLEASFLTQYVIHFNGSRAIKESGYQAAPHQLRSVSAIIRSRPNVKKVLQEYLSRGVKNKQDIYNRWQREVAAMAFTNPDDIASWDDEGNMRVIPSDQMEPAALSAIQNIDCTKHFEKGEVISTQLKITRESKLAALKLLGAAHGFMGNQPGADDESRSGTLSQGRRAQLNRELADAIEAFEKRMAKRPGK